MRLASTRGLFTTRPITSTAQLPLANGDRPLAVEADDRRLEPCHFVGQPLVLGFSRVWTQSSPEVLSALRKELRGLGASLLLFAPTTAVCLRPDDELRLVVGDGGFDRAAFKALLPRSIRYRRRHPALALLVVDADGVPTWHGQADCCDDPLATVAQGLAFAGQRMCERRSAPCAVAPRELLTSLAAAFALALS